MKQTLHYNVDPFDPAGHRLKIQLQMPKPKGKSQIVSLPSWIPGSYLVRDFSRHVETIRAWCGKKSIIPQKIDTSRWELANCDGPVTIEIIVYAWDLSVREAHVDETHAFFNGTSVFLMPDGFEQLPCTVRIGSPPHQAKWRAYTSMPALPHATQRQTLGWFQAPNYDAVVDHPFELGTPQVVSFKAGGALHEMLFTGTAPNLDVKRIARDTQRICEAQIELFEPDTKQAPFLDSANKYVFMTLITKDGYGGLEHRASTALVTSRKDLPVTSNTNQPDGYTQFLGLVSHEYFHNWHVKRIKPAAFAPYDLLGPNHTRLLWVFEGFTSYYDDLMLVRSGALDLPGYLKSLGKTIASVHTGSGRQKQSLSDSSFDAWTKYYKQNENAPNAIVSYYTKGALVALGLDLTIRQSTNHQKSLDDVMRQLWKRYGKDFYRGKPIGLGEQALSKLVLEITGVNVESQLEQWVNGCEDVPLGDLLVQESIELMWKASDNCPDLGITVKPSGQDLSIRQVFEQEPAHKAGLSAGDALVAVNGLRISNSAASLKELLRPYAPGQLVEIHFFRGDTLHVAHVHLAAPKKNICQLHSVRL